MTDVDEDALAVARANLAGLGSPAARVRIAAGSWYDALPSELEGRLLLVVANPPYLAEHELADLPEEVRAFEPHRALVSGPTGLEHVATLVAGAPAWLDPAGTLVAEVAPHQSADAVALARDAGFADVAMRPDLAGRDRVLVARRRG
jgi:release factor glutamine methyltransferase